MLTFADKCLLNIDYDQTFVGKVTGVPVCSSAHVTLIGPEAAVHVLATMAVNVAIGIKGKHIYNFLDGRHRTLCVFWKQQSSSTSRGPAADIICSSDYVLAIFVNVKKHCAVRGPGTE